MEDKHWNHNITATDTAKDLALVVCDIYSNTNKKQQALNNILVLCKEVIENKGA